MLARVARAGVPESWALPQGCCAEAQRCSSCDRRGPPRCLSGRCAGCCRFAEPSRAILARRSVVRSLHGQRRGASALPDDRGAGRGLVDGRGRGGRASRTCTNGRSAYLPASAAGAVSTRWLASTSSTPPATCTPATSGSGSRPLGRARRARARTAAPTRRPRPPRCPLALHGPTARVIRDQAALDSREI